MMEVIMAQNREPPAYQEYASTIMAKRAFKLMTLAERGLLYTIRLECWVNQRIPNNTIELAKCLGFSEPEMQEAMTPNIKAFLQETGMDYVCPDLEEYRKHLAEIRQKKAEGGRQGALKTNAQRRANRDSIDSQVTRQDTRETLVKLSPNQYSQTQSLEEHVIDDDFVSDYESAEVLNHNF